MKRSLAPLFGLLVALAGAGCGGSSPVGPSVNTGVRPVASVSDGARLTGAFEGGSAQSVGFAAAASFEELHVYLDQWPQIATTVDASGRFALDGVPAGSWVVQFQRDGSDAGAIPLRDVRDAQDIHFLVTLTGDGEVVLLAEEREDGFVEGGCPRGAGFWCQNSDGQSPNLTRAQFEAFAADAALLLSALPELDGSDEVAAAVCDTGDQLLRQLATLALNVAAGTHSLDTPLAGEPFATVGEALDAGVAAALDAGISRDERNDVKDVLERINEDQNTGVCQLPDEPDDGDDDPPASGQMTICHVPPGNPAARHTLVIDASAWPAHRAHGDTVGPC